MSSPALEARPAEVLRRLELRVTRKLDGVLAGNYLGLVPGQGSEAGETRPYVPGDDVRRIDWNVTARSQEAYTRETIADRELEAWLLVDRSPSLDFGTASVTKRELAMAAAGAFGILTSRAGNRVGAVVVEPGGVRTVPARPGRTHLLSLLHSLHHPVTPDPGAGTTDLGAALRHLVVPPRRRGLVVVVSDFLSIEGWERPLRGLAARHDVVAAEIVDPRELELPAVGVLTVVDPETGRQREVVTSAAVRRRYASAAANQRAEIARLLAGVGASHLQLRTDRDWLADVGRFVIARRRRVRR